jgi:hypothetical protein
MIKLSPDPNQRNSFKISSTSFYNSVHMSKVQESQKALFLQGGGSLGAYEAVVYQALYERIPKGTKWDKNWTCFRYRS